MIKQRERERKIALISSERLIIIRSSKTDGDRAFVASDGSKAPLPLFDLRSFRPIPGISQVGFHRTALKSVIPLSHERSKSFCITKAIFI